MGRRLSRHRGGFGGDLLGIAHPLLKAPDGPETVGVVQKADRALRACHLSAPASSLLQRKPPYHLFNLLTK